MSPGAAVGGVSRTLALGGVLVLVSLSSGFFLSSGLSTQQVPELGPEDLGKPFRASSPAGFKASRDFEVADDQRTAQRRAEARDRVRPVFDYDPTIETKAKRDLRDGFEAMQELVQEFRATHTAPSAAAPVVPQPKKAPAAPAAPVVAKDPKGELENELTVALRDARRRFEEHAPLTDDEDFEVLVQARFSPELEQAALGLLELAWRGKVVPSRDELSRIDSNGITVRILGGRSEGELGTAQPQVFDVREVSSELDRFASVPGNLLPESPPLVRRAVLRLAKKQVRSNLSINAAETSARRDAASNAVKPVLLQVKKGERVIADGELVTETHLLKLRGLREQMSEFDLLQLQIGGAGMVALVLSGAWLFFQTALRRFKPTRRDALFMGLAAIALMGLLQLWLAVCDALHDKYPSVPLEALHLAFPVAAGAMLVRFVLSEEAALYFAICFAALVGIMLGNSLPAFLFTLVTSLVAADRMSRVRDRAGLFGAGAIGGLIGIGMVIFMGLASGRGVGSEIAWSALLAAISAAVAAPMLVLTLTPVAEAAFGYASDLKLLELANLNHPALKELVLQAPGTYHHSIIMGSLVEAAAESIGANPLLARSCAYYHDIGKGRNPGFFGENQKGTNAHDGLAPQMSAVIIKRHVTEGLEMARQYKLPRRVADAIPQHHGTRLVGYFFHKAQRELDGKENAPPIDESIYRYPGPRPQFREAALCMIADAVEASCRSIPEPTTEKLRAQVQKMINLVSSEGQLDECDLTLKDLAQIAESMVRTLDGIYHARPEYPPGAVRPQGPGLVVVTNESTEPRKTGA
ncbi:MAG: HDIG domain-containing protein [Archangiaceae bacterium]|nr:HDIG domain-containing protein [Archangiaceae bacterium]